MEFRALSCFMSSLCFLHCEDVSTLPYAPPVATTWIHSCEHAFPSAMHSTSLLKASTDAFSPKLPFADYNPEKSKLTGRRVLWTRSGGSQGTVRCQAAHSNGSACQGASCFCCIVRLSHQSFAYLANLKVTRVLANRFLST